MPMDDSKEHDRRENVRLNPNCPTPNTTASRYASPSSTTRSPNSAVRFLSFLFRAVIMAFIVSLLLLLLGVAAVVFLHIFVASGAIHRQSISIRRRTTRLSGSAYSAAYTAKELQRFLPRIKYVTGLPESAKDCAVCLESFKEGDWCRSLPVCSHIFHDKCVDRWLNRVPNCPICRTHVRLSYGASASAQVVGDCDDSRLLWAVGVGQNRS